MFAQSLSYSLAAEQYSGLHVGRERLREGGQKTLQL